MATYFKRATNLFTVATLPSALVAAACDLLSPVGGGWLALLLGAVALASLSPFLSRKEHGSTLLERLTAKDEDLAWWWQGSPFIRKHGVQVVALFGLICIALGLKSLSLREQGGFLASRFPAVAAAQRQLNLMEESLVIQKRIESQMAGVKRETSDDPSKELANLGFDMSHAGVFQAVMMGRADAIELFAETGISLPPQQLHLAYTYAGMAPYQFENAQMSAAFGLVHAALLAPDARVVEAVALLGTADSPEQCLATEAGALILEYLLDSTEREVKYRTLCAGGKAQLAWSQIARERQRRRDGLDGSLAQCVEGVVSRAPNEFDGLELSKSHMALLMNTEAVRDPDTVFANLAYRSPAKYADYTRAPLGGKPAFRRDAIAGLAEEACRIALDATPQGRPAVTDESLNRMLAILEDG